MIEFLSADAFSALLQVDPDRPGPRRRQCHRHRARRGRAAEGAARQGHPGRHRRRHRCSASSSPASRPGCSPSSACSSPAASCSSGSAGRCGASCAARAAEQHAAQRSARRRGHDRTAARAGAPRKTFAQAAWQIVIADVSMSLDNVLAVAGAAREHPIVLIFGLALSIALMGIAASFIARLLQSLSLDRLCRARDHPLCGAADDLGGELSRSTKRWRSSLLPLELDMGGAAA